MARSYANILTAIWRSADFRRLSAEAQRAYLMLVTQPDISAAGTLDLTVRRWADLAEDTKVDDILRALVTLSDARYIVVDHDTEELLVRSFVRHDKGYGNRKRRPAILEAARDARSPLLRRALAAEFNRLGLPTAGLTDGPDDPEPRDRPSDSPSSTVDNSSESWETRNSDVPGMTKAFSQVEGLSDSPQHRASASNWVVGTKGEYRELPQPATLNPQPATTGAPRPAAGSEEGEDHVLRSTQDGTGSPFVPAFQAPPVVSSGTPSVVATDTAPHVTAPSSEPADPEHALVDQVRDIRPDWSRKSIIKALRHPDVLDRPWPVIERAMLAVARDGTTQAPGRVKHDGPWWTTAARATGAISTTSAAIEAPCGQCGPNRQIELPDGRPARCPTCHPLRATA